MTDLFEIEELKQAKTRVPKNVRRPLADRLRPEKMAEIFGHAQLLENNSLLQQAIRTGTLPSLILWGPPGCGKTTLAMVLAKESGYHFIALSAALHSTPDVKKAFADAEKMRDRDINTLLLVDEIHRFNRTQQDLFLPYIEKGIVTMIGATTENPSFELNSALLSRCKVLVLKPLDAQALENITLRAEKEMGKNLPLDEAARKDLIEMADGDGRYLLNLCEELLALPPKKLDVNGLRKLLEKRALRYDKSREEHYNLISALHKSMRGSDPDAALYWLARMLAGGEEPLYIVRRLVRFAVEDIGIADPEAVHQALAAKDTYDFLGSPEGELAIVQAAVYLATAPKSNATYNAYNRVKRDAVKHGSLMPPKHILNAPTQLMKDEGYGKDYNYDHDTADSFSGQNYFPDEMKRQKYYEPKGKGFEHEIKKRLEHWEKLRKEKK